MPRSYISPGRLLRPAVAAALVLALLPTRFTRWLEAASGPLGFAIAPISDAAAFVSRSFRPARQETVDPDSELARLRAQRDALQTQLLQSERTMSGMERLIRDLQGGFGMPASGSVRSVAATVVGSTSDLADGAITIRAGDDEGLVTGHTIAVANGVHLVGRVIDVGPRLSRVLPISRRKAGKVQAVIMPLASDDSMSAPTAAGGVLCQLEATGDGRLKGPGPVAGDGATIEPGQIVRVSDPDWPDAAQMLVLGRVESVSPRAEQPQRLEVVVRPELRPDRVRQVVLRIPIDPAGDGGAR